MEDAPAKKMTVINCEPTVDITVVEELLAHLKKALNEKHDVSIEAENIQRVDGAVLQLFAGFFRDAEAAGVSVTWKSKSDALVNAATILGLQEKLDLV